MVKINKNPRVTLGWSVNLVFDIHLHSKDIEILHLIQRFFGVGNVYVYKDKARYQVQKSGDLVFIIEHFTKYPLKTKKYADFILFTKAFDIVKTKEHLSKAGLTQLINIRGNLNQGLPERLKVAFPNNVPVPRPQVPKTNLDSNTPGIKHWLAGFVSGEGCFTIKVSKSKTHKLGKSVTLNFLVFQHKIDRELLESFSYVLGCGRVTLKETTGIVTFNVTNFNDITDKIIPLFEECPILGVKAKDFEDFKKASYLIKDKAHLTSEGLAKILLVKSRMNTKRELE
jgi:hypothetical protein